MSPHVWIWPDIHMTPEEGVRAHVDLSGGTPHGAMLPIHWGTFNLAPHPWADPAEGTLAAARELGAKIATPRPGAPFEPSADLADDWWWRAVAVPPAGGWPQYAPVASDAAVPDGAPEAPATGESTAGVDTADAADNTDGSDGAEDYEVARPR
ncbi:hypothetical protein [Streptomyces sp. H39-S7]|uniref:hypothetical protein n=1 Tax=Streptomyces sp. H39-S7 TaxID=3004357 RepID=UPI003FA78F1A